MILLTFLLLFLALGIVTFMLTIGIKGMAFLLCGGDIIVFVLIIWGIVKLIKHFKE